MRLLLYLIIVAIVSLNYADCQYNANVNDKKTPRQSFDLGAFQLDSYFNETKYKDKLKVSKSYIKLELRGKPTSKSLPISSLKMTRREELINCDNLTLDRIERQNLIQCKSLQSHLIDDSVDESTISNTIGSYVRRSSVKIKLTIPWESEKQYSQLYLYPLRDDVVQESISSCMKAHDLGELKFVQPTLPLGYYFELHVRKLNIPLIISGDFLLLVNKTEIFTRLSNDEYPEFADELSFLFKQAKANGYFLSLQNVSLHIGDLFTFETGFTILQQLQFPYLTVHHNIVTKPIEAVLKYEASVSQTRDLDATNLSAYNTTVKINSYSGFLPIAFELNQVFVNENEDVGYELMQFIHAALVARVQATWSLHKFIKTLRLYFVEGDVDLMDIAGLSLKESIQIHYSSADKEDYVDLLIRIKKDLYNSFYRSSVDSSENSTGLEKDDHHVIRGIKNEELTSGQPKSGSNFKDEL